MAKVTVLCPNMSVNALGRADLLARLLLPRHEVQVVGPAFGDGLWAPLRGPQQVPYVAPPAPLGGWRGALKAWDQVEAAVHSFGTDLLYVSKPFGSSLWLARRFAREGGRLLLDIDDYEPGIVEDRLGPHSLVGRTSLRVRGLASLFPRTPWNTWLGERWARRVPLRTVSNHFLQERYGGEIVWHARDEGQFDPSKADGAAARRRHGLPAGVPLVLFFGTPRGHKGLDDLVTAATLLPPGVHLAIVGVEPGPAGDGLRRRARAALGSRAHLVPPVPFSEAADVLAMADVVAIPQQDTAASRGQMPAKVFDAMAMGKPVVATAVSDLPLVLDGCGVVVPPDDPERLAAGLRRVLDDPAEGHRLGALARQRFLERHGMEAVRKVLLPIVDRALA